VHARDVTQLDRLASQGERAGNHRLGSNHRRQGRQNHQRDQRPARRQQIERVARGFRIAQQHGALAEIVEHQCRQHQDEPGAGDGLAAEMAHVGVQRFGARQCQHHGTQDGNANAWMSLEETHGPHRVQCLEHFGMLADAIDTQPAQHQEPGHHHRPEQLADAIGTVFLDQKQRHQHHQRNRHNPFFQAVERQLQAFYC